MSNNAFDRNQALATASQNGIRLGLMWLASFGCTMYAMDIPFLGTAGNFIGLFSILACTRMIRSYRTLVYNLNWLQSLWFALTCFLNAALITTLGQYIYFAFLDQGHFINTISTMFQDPLYAETMKQNFPELDIKTLLDALASMSTRTIIVQLLFMNTMATGFCALLSSLFGGLGRINPQPEVKS